MDKKKKIIIVIVIILAIILLSVGGYFIYKNLNSGDDSKEDGNSDTGTDTGTDVDNSSGSSGVSNIPTNPFSNSADLKKFQQYVINVKGDKAVLGTGGDSGYGDDGKWGRKSALAYDKYGADYQAYLKAPLIPPKITTTTTTNLANSSLIKEGDKVYTRSTGKLLLYEFPSTDSEIGYLNTGTYEGGCNKSGNVNICMDKPIGTALGVFPDQWIKVRVDVKHYYNKNWYSAKWTTTPQDFFVKSFSLVRR